MKTPASQTNLETNQTAVLVVGGSLVGLSAAMFLAWQRVPVVLVERHPGSSIHPRATGFTTRTLELFRAVGLGSQIPQVPAGFSRPRRVKVHSLAGKWESEIAWTPAKPQVKTDDPPPAPIEYSLCTAAALPQDRLEPILRARAVELGADIRLSTRMTSFEQDADCVTALMQRRDGSKYAIRAQYLIAADGQASSIREALGISRSGRGHLRTIRSLLFRAPLDQYLESGISQFEVEQPNFSAMLTTYRDGRWLLMFSDDQERDEPTLKAMVNQAIGRTDLPVEIVTTGRWELSASIADRFSSGRLFLAGDSAHTLPPARGGFGANTGIEDAHNLAWKLAAVLSGASARELLNTYEAERKPIAWLRHDQIFARPDYAQYAKPHAQAVAIIEDDALELGQLYRSPAVLDAGADLPPALRPDQWAGQPGTRAPHVWVACGGAPISTLDLVQRDWVVLTQEDRWMAAAQSAAEKLKLNVKCVLVGEATTAERIDPNAFLKAFGIGPSGASLIRPDGYVAWRCAGLPANANSVLAKAITRVAHKKILEGDDDLADLLVAL